MKKATLKKLAFNRETLASLSADILGGVAGGNAGTTQLTNTKNEVSVPLCVPTQTQFYCVPKKTR
jgi:hypothetical protein